MSITTLRWLAAGSMCVWLAGGCNQHTPTARSVTVESDAPAEPKDESAKEKEPESPHPKVPMDSFHGMGSIHGSAKEQPNLDIGPEVDLGTAKMTAPKDWVRKQPRVEFIRAEFMLPKAEGDKADGRLTVSTDIRGTLQENIDRWKQQFVGKPEKESQEKIKAAGVEVTLVDFSGTYSDQRGPFAPAVEAPSYRMLGAIFDLGGQLYFVKATGPAKTMAAHAGEFRKFVESLKKG